MGRTGVAAAPAGATVGEALAVHPGGGLVAVVTPRESDRPTRSAPESPGVVTVLVRLDGQVVALVTRDALEHDPHLGG